MRIWEGRLTVFARGVALSGLLIGLLTELLVELLIELLELLTSAIAAIGFATDATVLIAQRRCPNFIEFNGYPLCALASITNGAKAEMSFLS